VVFINYSNRIVFSSSSLALIAHNLFVFGILSFHSYFTPVNMLGNE